MIQLDHFENYSKIVLNRPDKKNALNREMIHQFILALNEAERNKSYYLIIQGAGENFCSGADLSVNFEELYPEIKKLFLRLYNFQKPIVSYVEGYCLAGGVAIAAASDLVFADQEAIFGLPEVKKGRIPSFVLVLLKNQIAQKHLFELSLTGEFITAQKALEIGLINAIQEPVKLPPCNEIVRIKKLLRALRGPIDKEMDLAFQAQMEK